eukprot:12984-Eustigmatos_ZCMA.PRE.1
MAQLRMNRAARRGECDASDTPWSLACRRTCMHTSMHAYTRVHRCRHRRTKARTRTQNDMHPRTQAHTDA